MVADKDEKCKKVDEYACKTLSLGLLWLKFNDGRNSQVHAHKVQCMQHAIKLIAIETLIIIDDYLYLNQFLWKNTIIGV